MTQYKAALLKAISNARIADRNTVAMILAQCQIESANFSKLEESFAYRKETLFDLYGKYFPRLNDAEIAVKKGRECIANKMYCNRMGNGDFESGEGWFYRGRGLIQITGKENYALTGIGLDLDLLDSPDLLLIPENAAKSAVWWLQNREGFMEAAARGDVETCTRLVNGGKNALPERQLAFGEWLGELA